MPNSDPSCLYSPAHATGECSTYKEWVDNESDSTPTSHAPHLLVTGPSDQTLQSPTSTHVPHLVQVNKKFKFQMITSMQLPPQHLDTHARMNKCRTKVWGRSTAKQVSGKERMVFYKPKRISICEGGEQQLGGPSGEKWVGLNKVKLATEEGLQQNKQGCKLSTSKGMKDVNAADNADMRSQVPYFHSENYDQGADASCRGGEEGKQDGNKVVGECNFGYRRNCRGYLETFK
ncbi:hypothetical protein FRX31_003983 [Thalictrum thalictroides]|uniref:Uncharacterized protein n=1 Tax=Thalictrum thalictroides TaxID=46969 RepID=A0A7J6XDB3_THATH|nr:hypothetical protein FRX31_003983 [Thalictrum thalictroides]